MNLNARAVVCRAENLAISAGERLLPLAPKRCPCCGWTGLRFRAFAVPEYLRRNVICPACGSFERHRAFAAFYPATFRRLERAPERVVHFAAEPCLGPILRRSCPQYWTSTFEADARAEMRLDLTALGLRHASCDVLLANHVLDCMPDDRPAIDEMYRVLRPGGLVLAAVTWDPAERTTRELPVASTRRYRAYGNDIHLRFAPFEAEIVNAAGELTGPERALAGIPDEVPVLTLRKSSTRG